MCRWNLCRDYPLIRCNDFENLWHRMDAVGDPQPVYVRLHRLYTQPHRVYHNFEHIASCLTELQEVRRLCEYPDEVEFALWFHDAIYEPRAKDNEEQSAQLASETARAAALPVPIMQRIAGLILATQHNSPPSSRDTEIIVDIDLSILGKSEVEFAAYEGAIRREYAWVADADFRIGRSAILRSFLKRPKLFNTPYFYEKYEHRARKNLQHSLDVLNPK